MGDLRFVFFTIFSVENIAFSSVNSHVIRDVNVSYFLGFPIYSMLVLTHLFF